MYSLELPKSILEIKNQVFDALGLELRRAVAEIESKHYLAYQLEFKNLKIIFREAKTTPTKVGQFVTLWKRLANNPIEPFHENDDFDFVIIKCKTEDNSGLFVFSKLILIEYQLVSTQIKKGKLGFRLYPKWCNPQNKQALKTQNWQTKFFIQIDNNEFLDTNRLEKLFAKDYY